jgi:membrane protease YdiL (CAAX protease family)
VRGHPLRQAAAFYLWLAGVVATMDFGVFRLPAGPWLIVGFQVAGYAAIVLPIVIWSPSTIGTLRTPRRQAVLGVVLVVAAIAYEALGRHLGAAPVSQNTVALLSTALGEELAFRGFIWERTRSAGMGPASLVVVNVAAFTAWHLVAVAAGTAAAADLIGVAIIAVILSLVRLRAGNVGLPALLHLAADISGV